MPPAADNERLSNARVLLQFATQEIRQAQSVDPGELSIVLCTAIDVLMALGQASQTLGVEPLELAELEAWVRRLRRA
jgi:hypothetical protein